MQTIPNELYEGLRKHFTNPPRHGELYHAPPVPLPSGAHWEDRHNALIQQHSIHSGNHDYVLTTDNRLRALGSDSSIPLWAAMALVAANSIEVAR